MVINLFILPLLLLAPLLRVNAETTENVDLSVRLKDLLTVRGVRDNPIIGFGLVIGLKGTGDSASEITSKSMKKMLQSLGLNPTAEIVSKNVAAVVVTAKLPPFARQGMNIDVTVSSIGDASSLANGHLIVTPLKAGDGQVYAVASGSLSLMGKAEQVKQQTIGRIPQGAIVEKEMNLKFDDKNALRLALNRSDFTTAARVARIINQELGGKFADAKDPSTIDLIVPELYKRNLVELVGLIENFKVIPDQKARIVINEKTGTVVAGGDLVIKQVALAHQEMMMTIGGAKTASNPATAGNSEPVEQRVMPLGGTTTVNQLVQALNLMGPTPGDLIAIFQALIKNGALQAELEIL